MIFKGYLPLGGKDGKRPTEEYKDRTEFYSLSDVESLQGYGGVLKDEYIQIDIDDDEQFKTVLSIIDDLNIKTSVLQTSRGGHFYFKNTNVSGRRQGYHTPIEIKIDTGIGSQNAVIPLKIKGNERKWLKESEDLDELPPWLYPVSRKQYVDFSKMEEGDGRNQTLFSYILVLQQAGLTKDEIRESIKIINRYILRQSISDNELNIILRDEAFLKESFYVKGKLQYEKLAKFLIQDHHVIKINGKLHIYKDGYYTSDIDEIERSMLQYIVNSTRSPRSEVMRYIELRAKEAKMTTPTLLSVANGILNLETKQLLEFNPNYIIKNQIPVTYNPAAYSEVMDKTLNKICCNDKQLRKLIEEMIGYTLFRRNELGKCFILTGQGANGKSTLLDVIKTLLGKENISSVALNELSDRFRTFQLEGMLANIGDDISNSYIEDNSTFKKLVTGETVNVERKGRDPFDFENYSKLIFSCNDIPRINDLSDGLKRRIIFIPFNAVFSKSDIDYDPFIIDKLLSNEALEYLLKIALEGLDRILYNREFTTPKQVNEAWEDYEKRNNPVLGFMEEGKIENESTKEVYLQYQTYCHENGLKPLSRIAFSREICKHGYSSKQNKISGKPIQIFIKN